MNGTEEMTVIEAGYRSRRSWRTWGTMARELWESRELIHRLWYRDFFGHLRQSFLGVLWMIFPPVATTLIFDVLRRASVVHISMEGQVLPYFLFVLIGSTLWQMFSSSAVDVTHCITGGAGLVSRVYFPRVALAMSVLGRSLVGSAIQLGVVFLSFFVAGYVPHWQVVFLPFLLVPLAFFSLGLGMFFAPIHSVVRDTAQALNVILRFAMFLAPTVYPSPTFEAAVGRGGSWVSATLFYLHTLNPVSHFMTAARDLVQYGTLTQPLALLAAVGASFLVLALGWRFFYLCEPIVGERL